MTTKQIAKAAFPEYKGRKFRERTDTHYQMGDYWDGGSRVFVKAVRLSDLTVHGSVHEVTNPMMRAAHARFEIPAGIALVEHSFFCGRDCGLTVVTAPAFPAIDSAQTLPEIPVPMAVLVGVSRE